MLAGIGFRSKRLKGQLVWPPLGKRCRKMWEEGKFYFLFLCRRLTQMLTKGKNRNSFDKIIRVNRLELGKSINLSKPL